tara:strand:- start:235 stop:411 length:177 start_codon:yes stop_codon:yes gene_type:complete
MELLGVGFVILFLVGFFSSSDSTGGSVDAVDEDVLPGWSTATFVFSAISMRRLYRAGF